MLVNTSVIITFDCIIIYSLDDVCFQRMDWYQSLVLLWDLLARSLPLEIELIMILVVIPKQV